ncbi:MAG: mismatch repair protein MutS [Devosia sp.]|nr:mismatch repair protein MutS [Devosia sp.]
MSKRDPKRLPHDFHLWTAVASTIDPLRRKGLLKLGHTPLPMPPPQAAPASTLNAPPKRKPARAPFLPPYQAPLPSSPMPEKAVDPLIRKKLGRGRIEIDGTIDLHGMTQGEARAALHRYLHARWSRGDRTLLVITGKGARSNDDYMAAMSERGILRTMLPIWLSEPSLAPMVSGWSVAARGHGGEGAWYVRLRRS